MNALDCRRGDDEGTEEPGPEERIAEVAVSAKQAALHELMILECQAWPHDQSKPRLWKTEAFCSLVKPLCEPPLSFSTCLPEASVPSLKVRCHTPVTRTSRQS